MGRSRLDLERLDGLVKRGEGITVVKELRELAGKGIHRSDALGVASLARRVNQTSLALRILNPIVRPFGRRKMGEASPEERAEYAASLIKIGAVEESLGILKALDSKVPEALLFHSFALVSVWNYAATIPILRQYISLASLGDYRRLVGMVNLAAAYVHERDHQEAEPLLKVLLRETKQPGLKLLHSNSLQLLAQSAVWQADWQGAEKYLEKAEAVASQASDFDLFFIKKWKVILQVFQSKGESQALHNLRAFKQEACAKRHWETARDCDLIEAICTKNEPLIHHLYFGTPFARFRSRVLSSVGHPIRFPESYVWRLKGKGKVKVPIDLSSGTIGGRPRFKVGQLLHRAMIILCSDFYRPFRIGSLGNLLYPGEFFNPISTPMKIHAVMKRVRETLSRANACLDVEENQGGYFMSASADVQIHLSQLDPLRQKQEYQLRRLREKCPTGIFSLTDASESLRVSPSTALRILNDGVKLGKISRAGKGSLTHYQFIEDEVSALGLPSKISV